ncbi:MAG: hypothetical protein ABSC94_23355 [Polyangiaceae bacterium]|jgi:hypothetical protein
MKHRMMMLPTVICMATLSACASEVSTPEEVGQISQAVVACPVISSSETYTLGGTDNNEALAAATAAFNLMKEAAIQAQSDGNLLAARSILAPQRYTYLSGTTCASWGCNGPGIEFDPSDPLYSHVTNAMKAELAFAQQNANVAQYIVNGLWRAQVFTNGTVYPSIFAIPALASYNGKTTTVHLNDPTSENNSHYATLTNTSWCNDTAVTISETVNESWAYAPIAFNAITDWRSGPPSAYVGVTGGKANGQTIANANQSFTPFMGTDGSNPFLLVSINGTAQNWAFENFTPINCWDNPYPTYTCSSSMVIDPVAYAVAGTQYDTNGNVLGPQVNPFTLNPASLYADPTHAGQWAMRVSNGTEQWGTFSQEVTLFGVTKYEFVVQ